MSEPNGKKKTMHEDEETIIESCECIQAMPTINIEGNVYIGYSPEQIVQIMKGIAEICEDKCIDCGDSEDKA